MATPEAIIVSDLHLGAAPRARTLEAIAKLLDRHPDSELILNGDIFEFSRFPAAQSPGEVLQSLLLTHPEFTRRLQLHLARGQRVTFVAGNHDAAISGLGETLRHLLDMETTRLTVAPWFVRRGRVHVEHGHVYDPDNAPLHPLAKWRAEEEPLGSALMRRFIASAGALEFAHAHDTTPVRGVLRAFRLYGPRAPWLIARYFHTAGTLCWEAATHRGAQTLDARSEGAERLERFAEENGFAVELVTSLCALAALPTHARFRDTFSRLYFDRVFAGVTGAFALGRLALVPSPPAFGVLALASGYLAASRSRGRYRERPCRELRVAAEEVARATGASRVVFGHTHVEEATERYLNLGSFTYAKEGRHPYAMIFDGERVERGHVG